MLSLFLLLLTEARGITTEEVRKEKWPLRLAFADNHACLGDAHLANASCTSLGVAKTGFPGDAGTRKLVVLISYNGESDLLLMQLREMHAVVDLFVVVESNVTLQGRRKPIYFSLGDWQFAPFADKLMHHVICSQERNIDAHEVDTIFDQARFVIPPRQDKRLQQLLRKDDMIVTLDTDEIPSVRALALVKRCAPQRVHFKMREFFLSFEFVRDKQPRQASACTFAHAQHSICRVPGRIFLPGLSGILLGKFGGRAFFDHRMRTNMNEQRKELTPAVLDQLYLKFQTGRKMYNASPADYAHVCTLSYAPELIHPSFRDWRRNVTWHRQPGRPCSSCDSYL